MPAYLDGLLEGHESGGHKALYYVGVVCYVILTIFAGVGNIGLVTHAGYNTAYLILGGVLLGLLGFSLFMIRSYRVDGLDPKFKKATMALILIVVLLDVASVMIFAKTLNDKPPEPLPSTSSPPPSDVPTTPSPSGNATPTPTNFSLRSTVQVSENRQRDILRRKTAHGTRRPRSDREAKRVNHRTGPQQQQEQGYE